MVNNIKTPNLGRLYSFDDFKKYQVSKINNLKGGDDFIILDDTTGI